eukprot:TRINITY_DN707_c0_g1::TRINITY_DN707_c0_g1_i1::g.18341::m.18341 TRINITY_DN707_c0_g1::TRINITY_DN707_c0_g1_i1::g.18341  ORF type:complete len:679 (+),score=292.54,sp/Q55G75/Y7786_DICDI/23.31/1e-12,PH/PF00169.24/8.1e-12,PH_11/PF15413.1/2.3e-05,Baculo_PEP_C/PF04513.7/60,Baculo_PEP_C/PF04513.7/0.63,Baculo_PEP_C/PF04513.7/77,Baculo_PEP_C/PF04513.7/83,DUF883/PF05957.8/19,DUF883/PF05957.8/1.6e+02,DUF883/PF05957.8/1.8e+02,DUF883/PF05957.8/1.7e+03,YPEB/PF14620.1/1.1e+03,YPEB/PF14620.1/0.027,PH_8/PF15409.1/0
MSNPLNEEKQKELKDECEKILKFFGEHLAKNYGELLVKTFKAKAKAGPPKPRKVPTDVKGSEHNGFIRKRGAIIKSYKNRHMRLRNNELAYFKSETDTTARGQVPISGDYATRVCVAEKEKDATSNTFTFEVYNTKNPGDRVYFIECDSAEKRKQWMASIDETCKILATLKFLSSPNPENEMVIKAAFEVTLKETRLEFDVKEEAPAEGDEEAPPKPEKEQLQEIVLNRVKRIADPAIEEGLGQVPEMLRGKAQDLADKAVEAIVEGAVSPVFATFEKVLDEAQEKIQKPLEASMDLVIKTEEQVKDKLSELVNKAMEPIIQVISAPIESIFNQLIDPVADFYKVLIGKVYEAEKLFASAVSDLDKLVSKVDEVEIKINEMIDQIEEKAKGLVDMVKKILGKVQSALEKLGNVQLIGEIFKQVGKLVPQLIKIVSGELMKPIKQVIEKVRGMAGDNIDKAQEAIQAQVELLQDKVVGPLNVKTVALKLEATKALGKLPAQVKAALMILIDAFVDAPEGALALYQKTFVQSLKDSKVEIMTERVRIAFIAAGSVAYGAMKTDLSKACGKSYRKLTAAAVLPNVLDKVMPPIRDSLDDLRKDIPDAVKQFVDPVTVVEDFIAEQLETTIGLVTEPVQQVVDDTFARIAASFA